jgi:L-lactate dehydrogenase complex protein LldG
MEESTPREKVLKKVREAIISKTDPPYPKADHDKPLYNEMAEPADITFAQQLTKAGGNFIYCSDEMEFLQNLKLLMQEKDIPEIYANEPVIKEFLQAGKVPFATGEEAFKSAKTGLTTCEFLVSRTGSIMVSSALGSGRRLMAFPETHMVIAFASQLAPELKDALAWIHKKYEDGMPSLVSLITGPSRTADIEKTLVMGAHGPRELYVFFIEDRKEI